LQKTSPAPGFLQKTGHQPQFFFVFLQRLFAAVNLVKNGLAADSVVLSDLPEREIFLIIKFEQLLLPRS